MIVLVVGSWLLAGLVLLILRYCLRVGAVGGGATGIDAHRDKQPIRFWTGILALAAGAAWLIVFPVYVALQR